MGRYFAPPNPASSLTGNVYFGAGLGPYFLRASNGGGSTSKTSQAADDTKLQTDGFTTRANTILVLPQLPSLRLGLEASSLDASYRIKSPADTAKGHGSVVVFQPSAAYQLGAVSVGLGYSHSRNQIEPKGGQETSNTYGTLTPAISFSQGPVEAGVVYTTPTYKTAASADDSDIDNPATVLLHGRYAVDSALALGATLENINYSSHDDSAKDQQKVKLLASYRSGALTYEGSLGYDTAYAKDRVDLSVDNMAMYTGSAFVDYAVAARGYVGGGFEYSAGSARHKVGGGTEKLTAANTAAMLRGGLTF